MRSVPTTHRDDMIGVHTRLHKPPHLCDVLKLDCRAQFSLGPQTVERHSTVPSESSLTRSLATVYSLVSQESEPATRSASASGTHACNNHGARSHHGLHVQRQRLGIILCARIDVTQTRRSKWGESEVTPCTAPCPNIVSESDVRAANTSAIQWRLVVCPVCVRVCAPHITVFPLHHTVQCHQRSAVPACACACVLSHCTCVCVCVCVCVCAMRLSPS
jgi:hypothetical protein